MKQLYSLTTLAIALVISAQTFAQTYSGTYTAVLPGDWHATGGDPGIWLPTEPPKNCDNCLIIVDVSGTVNLNTNVNLSHNARIVIGGTHNTILTIGNSSATDWDHSYSLILANDGTNSTLDLPNSNAILNAISAGDYDGILTSFTSGGTTTLFKQMGNAPSGFVGTMIGSTGAPSFGKTAFGATTLNSTGTLPIMLSDFSAVVNDGAVDLRWSTSMEINADHFSIERSNDAGTHWTGIGVVAAHGNSSTVLNYSFTDSKVAAGTSQYRLQMVDRDGKFSYSDVKAVRNGLISAASIYPNPAHDYVNVTLGGNATQNAVIQLLSQTGQLLQEKKVTSAGGGTVALPVSSYPQGNYLLVVINADGSKQISKLLISK